MYNVYKIVHVRVPLHADRVLTVFYTCGTSNTAGDNRAPATASSHLRPSKVKG